MSTINSTKTLEKNKERRVKLVFLSVDSYIIVFFYYRVELSGKIVSCKFLEEKHKNRYR